MRGTPTPIATYPGKRLLDVGVSAAALVVAAPVMGGLWSAVRLTMGSPVLFRQRRPGLMEREFVIYKFRTMSDARGEDGELLPDGKRLTRLGRFLRKTSLDELPELFNVLGGSMSLVGPRPLLARYLPYYTDRERARHRARPGITGLAQVLGRNSVGWDDRLELDAVYIENMSFWLDVRILARTFAVVVGFRGVSPDPDAAETWLDEERSARRGPAAETKPTASESPV